MQQRSPRIQIMLAPKSREIFTRLANAQGKPLATIVSQFLDEMSPVLANVGPVVERAVNIISKVSARERDRYADAEAELLEHASAAMSLLAKVDGTIDQLSLDLGSSAKALREALPSSMAAIAARPVDPLDTNRGVNIPVESKKRDKTSRIKSNPHVSLQTSVKRRAARKTS